MDISKYMTGAYITAKDLGEEVRDETIADTRDGQYGKPELVFESKDKLSLNATNLKIMTKHYGRETNLWVGIMIRLVRGEATFNGNRVPSVVIVPVSPAIPQDQRLWRTSLKGKLKPQATAGDMHRPLDDDIPFSSDPTEARR